MVIRTFTMIPITLQLINLNIMYNVSLYILPDIIVPYPIPAILSLFPLYYSLLILYPVYIWYSMARIIFINSLIGSHSMPTDFWIIDLISTNYLS